MSLIDETVQKVSGQDSGFRDRAVQRLAQLTMPCWALGRLMDLAVDLAGMTRSLSPAVQRRAVVVMAADHGVAAEGVSKYPSEVTAQMVHIFLNAGAAINAIASAARARVVVVDMGVAADLTALAGKNKVLVKKIASGTKNMAHGPAMSRGEAERCVEAGIEVARELGPSIDLFAIGDMGIANTTAASAIVAAFTGSPAIEVTGRGTGIDDVRLQHKVEVIERALKKNLPDPTDGLDVLAKVGGLEIGGIAGLILGAASMRKPVILDGFPVTAGALVAHSLAPLSADYMVAALAMGLVEAAARILTDVATFEEAGVARATS